MLQAGVGVGEFGQQKINLLTCRSDGEQKPNTNLNSQERVQTADYLFNLNERKEKLK